MGSTKPTSRKALKIPETRHRRDAEVTVHFRHMPYGKDKGGNGEQAVGQLPIFIFEIQAFSPVGQTHDQQHGDQCNDTELGRRRSAEDLRWIRAGR